MNNGSGVWDGTPIRRLDYKTLKDHTCVYYIGFVQYL